MQQTERKEFSLVPVRQLAETEKPILTEENKRTISALAIPYLKKRRIRFTAENLQGALEVLAFDALPRGMHALGQKTIDSEKRLKTFINKGIEERESVFILSQRALASAKLNQVGEFLGPYALERKLMAKANSNIPRFPIETDISDFEKLAYNYVSAKRLLPVAAEAILNTLPKEIFTKTSLENFPTPEERAKLIRNALASVILGGGPSPLIRIEHLEKFVTGEIDKNAEKNPIDAILKLLPEDFQSPPETKKYLENLLSQIKESLPRLGRISLGKTEAEKARARDEIFKNLQRTFLLLHPALEEEPIITDINQYQEGLRSLWSKNMGVEIEDYIIPSPDSLRSAQRVEYAKGKRGERFSAGLAAWDNYEHVIRAKKQKIAKLKEMLAKAKNDLESFSGIEPLPSTAYEIGRINYPKYRSLSSIRAKVSEHSKRIKGVRESARAAKLYYAENFSESENKRPLLARLRKPRYLGEENIRRAKTNWEDKVTWASRLLPDNLQTKAKGVRLGDFEKLSEKELALGIRILNSQIKAIIIGKRKPFSYDFSIISAKIISQFVEHASRNTRGKMIRGDSQRLKELRALDSLLYSYQNSEGEKKEMYLNLILTRFNLYELREEAKILEALKEAKTRLRKAQTDEEFLYWTREEALAWIDVAKKSVIDEKIPDKEKTRKEFIEWQDTYRNIEAKYKKEIFPKTIPSPVEFEGYIERKILDVEERLREQPPEKNTYDISLYARVHKNLEGQLISLKALRKITSSPIFNVAECYGMSREDFLKVIDIRFKMLHSLIEIEKMKPVLAQEEKAFSEFVKNEWQRELKRRKENLEIKLKSIIESTPEKNFLTKFIELNFAIKKYPHMRL